ncbi:MAG: PAS domain S-box protein [Betaproteobacteria bacterium]|nr:PAS domain S-box protein [Betaproteobacteria bacterium]
MNLIARWLPRSLFGSVFFIYSASLLLFTLTALGFFYYYQFTQAVDDSYDSASILADVVAPTLSDSVVIGDYDTVKRTLAKAAVGDIFSSAEFIDINGGKVRVENNSRRPIRAPYLISVQVSARLISINRNISVGGRDYGVFRLNFAPEFIANQIWTVTKVSLLLAALCLLAGLFLIWIPLRRIVSDLAATAEFAGELASHLGSLLVVDSNVRETQALAAALNRVSQELTAQHQALTDSEVRKSAIMEAALDCFITINDAGEIVDFNAAAERTFGYRADEVRGVSMSEVIVPPELRGAHEQGMRHYLTTGIGPILRQRIEITGIRRNGERFPIEIAVVPFEAEDRQYFAGFIRDITERKTFEAEQARINELLKKSVRELEYQKFALDQHSIVSITDARGVITYINDKFADISGYSREELVGSTHRIINSGLHSAAFFEEMWNTITAGEVWHGQFVNRNKGGDTWWVAATIVPWLDGDGRPYQYVAIRTDITAQKQVESALAEARQRELETGSEIQRSLLLGDLPEGIHGTHLATYTEPSQGIDGDFFAITQFRPDCFELLVGDVMGKGVPAALIGAGVKSTYNKVLAELFSQRANEHQLPTPAEIINALHQNLTQRLIELNAFVTLALYRFDCAAGVLSFVNAGHTAGLLARKSTSQVELICGDNLPIGVIQDEIYTQHTLPIEPGDAILVYSDGITESVNQRKEEFGIQRLSGILQAAHAASIPPSSLLQSIRQEVRNFVGNNVLIDDQTAVIVEIQPRRTAPRGTIEQRVAPSLLILPWRLDGLSPLRTAISTAACRLAPVDVDALILGCFEAATNILRHAEPYFSDATIACRLMQEADEFSVELIYPGPTFKPPDNPTPDFSGNSEGGFGLYIMNNCVDQVDYFSLMPGISSIRLVKRRSEAPAA